MNRRGFLGSIAAAIGAVSLPAAALVAPVTAVTNAGGTFVFTGPHIFDYGRQVGLWITLPDCRRQAVRTTREGWKTHDETVVQLKRALLDWAEKQYAEAAA